MRTLTRALRACTKILLLATAEVTRLNVPRLRQDGFRFIATLLVALGAFMGCESTDGGGNASGSIYYGVGFYDPWYYGGYWDDPDVIVTPPPAGPERPMPPGPDRPTTPPRPEHPIARPPSSAPRPMPMPSIPRTPLPRARPR